MPKKTIDPIDAEAARRKKLAACERIAAELTNVQIAGLNCTLKRLIIEARKLNGWKKKDLDY